MKLKVQTKLLNFIGIIILLNIVFSPPLFHKKFNIKEGEVAAFNVIAPYDYFIPKSEEELTEEKTEIAQRIPPVFDLDNSVVKLVNKKIDRLEHLIDSLIKSVSRDSLKHLIQNEYAISREVIDYLLKNNYKLILKKIRKNLTDLYSRGIVNSKPQAFRIITIIAGDKELVKAIDQLYSLAEAERIIASGTKSSYQELAKFFLLPNVTFSANKTQQKIDEVFANVPKTKGKLLKGEIIVEKHKRINSEALEKLSALENTYVGLGAWEILKTLIFRNLFYLSIIFMLYHLNRIARLNMFETKNLLFITLLSAVYLVIGKITYETNTLYLLPISFFIFLFALYFNFYTAIIFAIIFASIFGVVLNSLSIFTYLLASGMVASFSSQTIKNRLSLYRPLLYIGLTNVIVIIFINVYLSKEGINFIHLGEGVLNSIFGSVSVALLLPLFERLFDFTTDLTLLELGNLNLPIFKEMSLKGPGTFHHSVVVGNLSEAGASSIGADPILARVGAYYHDIGKLKKPDYFIENQFGIKSPHDNLKPQLSALVIISHVKDGIEMAKTMKLPRRLVDIIAEHHGTTKIESFYRKALHTSTGISEDAFSYPGPKPKTKEAALVMLADSVEAAARSEKNITIAKLQKILRDNFDRKFNDGQLDDCPINRNDLEQIKTAFLPILTGIFHPRIEYEEERQIPKIQNT